MDRGMIELNMVTFTPVVYYEAIRNNRLACQLGKGTGTEGYELGGHVGYPGGRGREWTFDMDVEGGESQAEEQKQRLYWGKIQDYVYTCI